MLAFQVVPLHGLVGLPHKMVAEYHGQVERGKETEKDAAFMT